MAPNRIIQALWQLLYDHCLLPDGVIHPVPPFMSFDIVKAETEMLTLFLWLCTVGHMVVSTNDLFLSLRC